jgi:succinyl-CoA synthetase beta subunit
VKIHEYQGKAVLAQYGVPVPKGKVAYTVDEAVEAAKGLGLPVVVKAQIHAGGRGKGGGVKLAKSVEECEAIAKAMLGMTLRTHQTGPEGRVVKRLLIEQGVDLSGSREMYLAILVDRATAGRCSWPSTQGGMEIEEVAAKDPKAILKEAVDPAVGLPPVPGAQARLSAWVSRPRSSRRRPALAVALQGLRGARTRRSSSQPVPDHEGGDVLALDAKVGFDDNALFRIPSSSSCATSTRRSRSRSRPPKHSLNYIKLDGGSVGCMVNGAGLAMATMDIIKLAGGAPANFLDVGGGANADQIKNAFRILLADKDVRAVFINIFGGILRCDVLAEGVIAGRARPVGEGAGGRAHEGQQRGQGQEDAAESGLNFETADDMTTAASAWSKAAGGAR